MANIHGGFPDRNSPLTIKSGSGNKDEIIAEQWYNLFIQLYVRSGGGSDPATIAFLQKAGAGTFSIVQASSGKILDTLVPLAAAGTAPVLEPLTTSPFTMTALTSGTMFCSNGTLTATVSRSGITVGILATSVPLKAGDVYGLSWPGATPSLTWFPD